MLRNFYAYLLKKRFLFGKNGQQVFGLNVSNEAHLQCGSVLELEIAVVMLLGA